MAETAALHPLQARFADLGAAQCGYCTPGILLAAKALLDEQPAPDARRDHARRSRATSAAAPATCRSSKRSRRRRRSAPRRRAAPMSADDATHRRHRQAAPPRRRPRQGHRPDPFADDLCCRACCTASCCARRCRTRASCGIDASRAPRVPGVHLVLTGARLPDPLRHPAGQPGRARALPSTACASSAIRSPRSSPATS